MCFPVCLVVMYRRDQLLWHVPKANDNINYCSFIIRTFLSGVTPLYVFFFNKKED